VKCVEIHTKVLNCEVLSFTNFLVNTLNKIITHYRWPTTSLFIMNICSPMFEHSTPGLSNAVPVIYFPGALHYFAGFNVNQNFKKKIYLNNSMFRSEVM
jgi:hypothetical protein